MSDVSVAFSTSNPPSTSLGAVLDADGMVDGEALARVEQALASAGQYDALVTLYREAAERAPDAELGRRIALSAGLLLFERFQDARAAEPFLRRVLASNPESLDALDALRGIALAAGRWEEAAELSEQVVALVPENERPDLLVSLADLVYQQLGQPDRALSALRYAYECDGSRRDVLRRARSIFVAEARWEDAKRVLDDEARAVLDAGEGGLPVNTGDVVAESAADTVDVRGDADPLGGMARAYRELGVALLAHALHHELAAECLERARALGDGEALSKLDELSHVKNNWEQKAASLRDQGFEARDKKTAAALYVQGAELFYQYGKDPLKADELLERSLLLQPAFAPALRFLEQTHRESERSLELIRRLNGMVASAKDPAAKVAVLLRMARRGEAEAAAATDSEAAGRMINDVVQLYRRALTILPGQREAAQRAAGLLEEQGRAAEQAQVLEAHLAALNDDAARIEAHLALGRLYAEQLGDSGRSRAHFEAVLALSPQHFVAASALRALYRDAREEPLLLGVLGVLVEYAPDLFSRLEILHEMAQVAEHVSREEAFSAWRRLFELDPTAQGAEERFLALGEALGRWQAVADAFVSVAGRKSGAAAKPYLVRAATIYDTKLPRPKEAIAAYQRALALDQADTAVEEALERLLRQQDDPQALIDVLRNQIQRNTDPGQTSILLTKLGDVLDRDLGDLDAAIATFLQVLEQSPEHPTALANLDDLYRRKGEWPKLLQVLRRREALAESQSDLAELQVRRARILGERLGRRDDAAELFLEVLGRSPDHAAAIQSLGQLLEAGVLAGRIARALEPIFAQRAQYARQLAMLRVLLAEETDLKKKRELAKKAAVLAESRLGDAGAAFELASEIVAADPSGEDGRALLLRLGTGRTLEVVALLETAFERTSGEAASQIASSVAELCEVDLNDRAKAIRFHQKALVADGGNAGAIKALERLLGHEERWAELAALLEERMSKAEEATAKVQLGLAIAALAGEHLGDLDRAIEAYRRVLQVEPKETTALAQLAEALEKRGRHRELLAVLDRIRDAATDSEVRAAIEARAGEVSVRLGERREALERYRRALGQRAGHEGAVRGLEALLADPEVRASAGALLEPYYAERELWRELVQSLEAQLFAVVEPERRRALFTRIAEVEAQRLGRPEAAFDTLVRAFREGSPVDRAALERLAAEANRIRELAQLYQDALDQRGADAELYRALGRLQEASGALDDARRTWEKLLALQTSDAEGLEALERLAAAGDNPATLAEVLIQRADAVGNGADAVAFLKRAAAIYEEAAEDLSAATRTMERVTQVDPRDRAAWQELQRYYSSSKETRKLANALESEALLVEEPLQRAEAQVRLADQRVVLGELGQAIVDYQGALARRPEHAPARQGLEKLLQSSAAAQAAQALEPVYRAAGDWAHLVEVYEILARASAEREERVERLVAIRSIYEERLGRLDRAFVAAARAWQERPDDTALQESMERLAKQSGTVEDLLALYEERAEALEYASSERAAVRARMAQILETVLADRGRAIEAWRHLLEERPGHLPALEALERLYARSGDARELVDVLRQMAGLLEEPERRVARLRLAARILESKLGDRAGAARIWEQVQLITGGDVEALDRLDALYADVRAFEDVARVLGLKITLLRNQNGAESDIAALWLRVGQLRGGALQDPRGALLAFGEILSLGERAKGAFDGALFALEDFVEAQKSLHPELAAEAARLGEPHWAQRGAWLKVVAGKEARIQAATDLETRRGLLFDVAHLYEQDLGQPEMAFLALTRAFSERPNDPELAAELERLASAADTEEELADLYAQVLPSIEAPELALRLSRRAAHVYDAVLNRGEAAVPFYNRVLALSPDDASALNALERIHRRAGNGAALVEVYRAMLRLNDDAAAQKALWRQIATIYEDDLEDLDGAFEAHQAISALDPTDVAAMRRMAALCERSGRLDHLAGVLEAEARLVAKPEERAQTYLRLGTLFREKLKDPSRAVHAYAQALAARKDDPGAIAGLAQIIREGGEAKSDAARALAPVYLESGAFEEYIACLGIQAQAATDSEPRKKLLEKIAQTYERLGRPEHAFTYYQRALREDLADAEIRSATEKLAAETRGFEELAALYLDEVDAVTDHDLMLRLRRRVAEIYDRELDDVERAITEYNHILDVAPGNTETLQALERLYRRAGSFGQLADVYRRRIAQTEDPTARVSLMREFSRLLADELNDAPAAIATLRRLLELQPTDVDALQRLAKLCAAQGRALELGDVLERLVGAAEPGSQISSNAKVALAKLKATKLGDLAGSDALMMDVLAHDPRHAEAREFLQERFQDAVAEGDAKLAHAAGEILATALRTAQEWSELISVLRMRATLAASGFERVPLNREIAAVYRDRLAQPDMAFSTLAQVYADAPGLVDVREELEALARKKGLLEELVEVWETALEDIVDGEIAGSIERRIAQILDNDLRSKDPAAAAWKRVLDRTASDSEALLALDRLYGSLGQWAALAEVLEQRFQLAQEDQKQELAVRLGALWDERLNEKNEAIEWYRKARALKTQDKETLQALALLLNADEAPQELYAVLEALVGLTTEERARVRMMGRMAELCSNQLQRPKEAIELWHRVMGIDPDYQPGIKALDALYEREGRWHELAKLLERQLSNARDEREVVRLQRRLGLVKGTRLGSVEEAVRSWTEILKRNPNDVEALNSLAATYRSASRWEDLVGTLRKLIPLQTDADGIKRIRFELAEVFLTHLNQREDAIESAKRVLDVEPHTIAELMRLEEIFVATGAFGEAVKVMNERVAQAENAGQKTEILFEIARVYEQKIHRKAGAAAAYEKILQLEPTSRKAYDALAAVYEQNGDYRKLVELQNRRLDVTELAEERRALLISIVDIQERWLGHPELAFTAACRAFAEEGADERAQALAERLAEETDNWEILAEVYLEQVENVGVARALEIRRRLGEIYADKLGEPERAEKELEQVLALRPEDEVARARLVQLFTQQERWRDVIVNYLDEVEIATDPEVKKILFRRIAEIEEVRLSDLEAAISTTKRILDLSPQEPRALMELVRLFRTSEKWHPLLNALQRRLELADSSEDRIKIRMDIAGVWETGIGDVEHAIEAYNDVLGVDAGHLPALKALEKLYNREERWIELIDVHERQVRLTEDPAEAIQILGRIASIWEECFRDLDGASRTLIRILEIDPEHLPTVKSLERVWRQAGEWEHLIEAHERHIELSSDKKEIVQLYLQVGEIQLTHLGRADAAETAFTAALEADPNSREAAHALGELQERHGNWFTALEMLQREAALIGPKTEAVELYHRMGRINEEMLMDRSAAKDCFARALDIEPGYAPAIRALRDIHEQDGNHAELIALYAQEAEYTKEPEPQAELYFGAGRIALEEFDDVEQASRSLEQALASWPDHLPSLRMLSDVFFGEERWDKAEKLLERLSERLDRLTDAEELTRTFYRLGYIAEKLGDDQAALRRYVASYDIDDAYLPTLEGLGAALLRAERWQEAQGIFQTILVRHKSALTDSEVVDLHYQIGELSVKLTQDDRAKRSFEKALGLDPNHALSLRASALLAERAEDWEEAYDLRERLISLLEGDERFNELMHQAKLCQDKIQEPYRAIDALVEARRLRPQHPDVLRALAALFDETSQVPRAVETLRELVTVLQDPKQQRDVWMQLATIYGADELAQAVHALNAALDLDPLYLTAFSKIEELLSKARNWVGLEENYHRMIKRMPKEQKKARIILWKSLGDLYMQVLRNQDGAKVAYEVVHKLEPESIPSAQVLAQLYARDRATAPKALEIYHSILGSADDPAVVARKMFELYYALGLIDRAFCALGALVLMRATTEDEAKAYAMLLKRAPGQPTRAATDTVWRSLILHPTCRNSLADILSVVYRGAPDLFEDGQKALRLLPKKERVDLANTKNPRTRLRYFDVWKRLADALNVGAMDHYHRVQDRTAPRLFPGVMPVLFAGEEHEAFKTMPPRQIAWTLARQMAAARPELAVVRALAPEDVAAVLEAAVRIYVPEGSGIDRKDVDARAVEDWKRRLHAGLSENALKALRDPVAACVQRREIKYLGDFLAGVEHSASRAALLMAGDVVAAERGLGESDQLVGISFRARVRELMLFTLSEDHFQLREKLGLAIPAAAEAKA